MATSTTARIIPVSLQRFVTGENETRLDGENRKALGSMTNICETDEQISSDEAVHALRNALDLLQCFEGSEEESVQVLDATAGALDEAALVVRPENSDTDPIAAEILDLTRKVKEARWKLLNFATLSVPNKMPESTHTSTKHDETALIVYASQTGTAKMYAKELKKFLLEDEFLLEDNGGPVYHQVDLANIRDITLHEISTRKRVYFVVSTFGSGRPPRDAECFFQCLKMADLASPLEGTEVAVAALGSTRFRNFCEFGVALDKALRTAGAKMVIPLSTIDGKTRYLQRMEYLKFQDQVNRVELGKPLAGSKHLLGGSGGPHHEGKQPIAAYK